MLVEAMDRILPTYPPERSASARRQLERLGVTVRTGTQVVDIDEHRSCASRRPTASEEIPARTVLWAAGVLASTFGRTVPGGGAETDRNGRIRVGPDLTIPGHPEIFVVGDAAIQPWTHGRPVPGVAQGGIQGGKYAAGGVWRRLRRRADAAVPVPDRGDVAVIGRLPGVTEHRVARAVRPPGRVHRLGAVARHPHRVPHRVREPDRGHRALGVVVPDPRPRRRG